MPTELTWVHGEDVPWYFTLGGTDGHLPRQLEGVVADMNFRSAAARIASMQSEDAVRNTYLVGQGTINSAMQPRRQKNTKAGAIH